MNIRIGVRPRYVYVIVMTAESIGAMLLREHASHGWLAGTKSSC
jgi:hypothetical protein